MTTTRWSCERRIAEIKQALQDLASQMAAFRAEQDELRDELNEIRASM